MRSIRRRLTYSNVMVTILAFIVLGGGAYAAFHLPRNSVRSKHIKNGQVKLADTNDALRLKCSRGTRYFEGACIETSVRSPKAWNDAQLDCFEEGKRLPSATELYGFAHEPGVTIGKPPDGLPGEWSDHSYFVGTDKMAESVQEDGRASVHIPANNTIPSYRCVRLAKR
jgi:hypothetical protein